MATPYSNDGANTADEIYYSNITMPVAFEGASTDYKNGLKGLLEGEADQLAVRELRFLQQRSSNAIRNNGYAKTALNKWVTNADSIQVVWKDKKGKKHKLMQDLWDEFTSNPSHDGFGDYKVFQGVSNSSIFTTGNSYIRALVQREGNENIVPLKLQLIPSQLHAITYNTQYSLEKSNEVIRYGIAFENSKPTKYFFRKSQLETKWDDVTSINQPIVVPSEEIIHTFFRTEPGQWLGIPLLAPILLSLYELDELIEATVAKQKASQAISMIVENANNTANMLAVGSPVNRTDNDNVGKSKIVFQARGGNVQYLNKGESIKSFQSADIGANFSMLIESELRRIAATLDLAYHELTGDTAGLNFSSLIGIANQSRNRLEYLHNFLFIPLREKPIAKAFKDLAVLYKPEARSAIPYFQLPRWRGTDDLKDAQADLLELQNGLGTYTDKLAERGLNFEDIVADRESLKELEKYGIILTSAAATSSMAQASNVQPNSNSTGN